MEIKKSVVEMVEEARKSGARMSRSCEIPGVSKRSVERWRRDAHEDGRKKNRPPALNALSEAERKNAIRTACTKQFRDLSPWQIVSRLAEKGEYIASESTFYRILNAARLLKHRSESKAPIRQKPEEFVAKGANEVWSWDITYPPLKAKGGGYVYLYVMDVWDRSIVGWKVHSVQSGRIASELVKEAAKKHGVNEGELTCTGITEGR